MGQPLDILASGMVTGVGLNAPASCAAIRAGINNVVETRFLDQGGAWLLGSPVPLTQPWRGSAKLINLVVPAIRECLATSPYTPDQIPLLLCVAEPDRPGRLNQADERLLERIERELGGRFHPRSGVLARGRVGGALAVQIARKMIYEERLPLCVVAGVDTLLVAPTVAAYEERDRLLTSDNSNGFIPGEAGAAVLLGPPQRRNGAALRIAGVGFGQEQAAIEAEAPLRADGLVEAVKEALREGGVPMHAVDFRITDANGEQYYFKEAALAVNRILRQRKETFDIWHPVDSIGEVGAAIGPCVLGVALAAVTKNYARGRCILCHFGNDAGERAALVLRVE